MTDLQRWNSNRNNLKDKMLIDPFGRPTVTTGRDHYFHLYHPYTSPSFENLAEQNEY